jgi:predicted amidohydrolase YtcJ
MMEFTSHSMWANSLALELAGIDENVQDDPERGMVYMRDSNGRLNGIVLENAGLTLYDNAFDPNVSNFFVQA